MTWVRYDDNVGRHPKVRALDDATYRLWREAIEWCSQNLTDGVILAHELGLTSTRASTARARKLVAVGLWHRAGHVCESDKCPPSGADGWVVHDYWDYQRRRDVILAEREKSRERQRTWMEKARRGKRKPNASTNGVSDATTNSASNSVENASLNGNPAPPRPAPKGSGEGTSPKQPPAAAARRGPAAGGEKTPDPAHAPPWPYEDPQVIAAADAELHRIAEARVAAIAADQARQSRGAAAARAALNGRPPPARPAVSALERLREMTPDADVPALTEEAS